MYAVNRSKNVIITGAKWRSTLNNWQKKVYWAIVNEVEGITGCYWDEKNHQVKSSAFTYDLHAQEKLWHISEELTHIAY